MTPTTADDLPDDMPLPKVPIRTKLIRDIADEHGVERATLVETLEKIHNDDLIEHGAEVHERYTDEWGDNAVILNTGIWEVLYVYPSEWEELRDRLALDDDVYRAVKACHQREAGRLIDDVGSAEATDYLQTNDKLITRTPLVSKLVEAGLSPQQASVQALRMAGITQERIAERLGNATGTIKSHCDRIDRKIEQARKLVDLVDTHGEVERDFD